MRVALTFALWLLAFPALAAPITVTLDDGTNGTANDQQTITNALDAYLKAQGINALMSSAVLFQKLQAAAQAASAAPTAPPATPVGK